MLDTFKREPGKVYPSWQDNPRLFWARLLRDLAVGQHWQPFAGVDVTRTVEGRFQVHAPDRTTQSFTVRLQRNGAPTATSFAEIIDHLLTLNGEPTMAPELNLQLKPNARETLSQLFKNGGATQKLDGRTINALRSKGLLRDIERGKVELTSDGLRALGKRVPKDEPEPESETRPVRFEHQPDPSQATQLERRPEPQRVALEADDELDTDEDFEPDGNPLEWDLDAYPTVHHPEDAPAVTQKNNALAAVSATSDAPSLTLAVAHSADDCADCRHKRILAYLMDSSPFVRNLIEQLEGVDRSMARLRGLE